MKLIGMMDSPYVRRVAISLELYGVEFASHPLSVFSSFEAFSRINPAVKAPTLVLDNGIRLMDSSLILSYFETQAAPGRKLLPVAPDALARDLQTLGFILAAGEKAVQRASRLSCWQPAGSGTGCWRSVRRPRFPIRWP